MLYIRVKETNIIRGFSDIFEDPIEGDICIDESDTRHFHIEGEINPTMCNGEGVYLYKYMNEQIVKKTEEEIAAEKQSEPEVKPVTAQDQLDTLCASIDYILLEVIPAMMI